MNAVDVGLLLALVCAVIYLIIQVVIVLLIAYKGYQDKQITKSLDKYRMRINQDKK